MLQGLSEADAEQVELRLLSDPEFGEEFDIMVDTIVDQYLDDELSPEERERAEQYFFKSESRREKLKIAAALKLRFQLCDGGSKMRGRPLNSIRRKKN